MCPYFFGLFENSNDGKIDAGIFISKGIWNKLWNYG